MDLKLNPYPFQNPCSPFHKKSIIHIGYGLYGLQIHNPSGNPDYNVYP